MIVCFEWNTFLGDQTTPAHGKTEYIRTGLCKKGETASMDKNTNSILASIKKMLGLEDDYTPFDMDVITHINSALMVLGQLGIGPKEGFLVEDYSQTWDEFVTNKIMIGSVRTYVYLYVKTLFDPPTNSFVMDAMKKQLDELAFRMNVQAESVEPFYFIRDSETARRRGLNPQNVPEEQEESDSSDETETSEENNS
jgi:hypothetical protein